MFGLWVAFRDMFHCNSINRYILVLFVSRYIFRQVQRNLSQWMVRRIGLRWSKEGQVIEVIYYRVNAYSTEKEWLFYRGSPGEHLPYETTFAWKKYMVLSNRLHCNWWAEGLLYLYILQESLSVRLVYKYKWHLSVLHT